MKFDLNFNCEKRKLDNGLEVILHANPSLPLVSVNIWYKVGSANESPAKTGLAHLLEHMMFQGSQHIKKEECFKFIQEAGGTINASTSSDRTNYFETLPANNLELALWLESDRMGFFLPALIEENFLNQRDVVLNERRERYDNQPYGRAWEILFSNLFPKGHPYSWATIGWEEHIKNFKLEDVKNFYKKHYAPNNAMLTIAGNIDTEEVFNLVKKYFDEIPPNDFREELSTEDFTLPESKAITHYDKVPLPRIYIAFPAVKLNTKEHNYLSLLANILTGSKSSRLTKKLVFEKQIAQNIDAYQYGGKYGGAFLIMATAQQNISIEELSFEIHSELKKFIADKIKEDELSRTKFSTKSTYIYSFQQISTLANRFNFYNFYFNKPDYFKQDVAVIENATEKDLEEVAQKYLTRHFTELRILPEKEK